MLSAMIKKEFLLVFRDFHALIALFVMPAVFILIMSVAMKDQFSKDTVNFTVFLQDKNKSLESKDLINKINKNESFTVSTDKDKAKFIVIIPRRYDKGTKGKLKIIVNDSIQSNQIEIFKSILSENVLSARFLKMSKTMEEHSKKASKSLRNLDIDTDALFRVSYNGKNKIPNSTQQSVPAWIVFGMFFIIIPMSTIYINERKQNTLARLNSMNISIFSMTFSKSIPYLLINQIQVWIMIAVGMYIVPLFDTPALIINGSILALVVISVALSITAVGVSSLIAVSSNSSEQATTIGGILNILLGAVGGVMVPKFIMPQSMQELAEFSPMSWGLDGYLDIFLKSADLSMIMDDVLKLFFFGIVALSLSMIILQIRINRGL